MKAISGLFTGAVVLAACGGDKPTPPPKAPQSESVTVAAPAGGTPGKATMPEKSVEAAPKGPLKALSIEVGGYETCARMSDGTMRCWGDNYKGQVGDGTTEDRALPTAVADLKDVEQVEVGADRACARTKAGAVHCWGLAFTCHEKNKALDPKASQFASPLTIVCDSAHTVPLLTGAAQISLGGESMCARMNDGTVKCRENRDSVARDGTRGSDVPVVAVNGLNDVTGIALGLSHACARIKDGTVKCWGGNFRGELGDGTTKNRDAPMPVKGLTDVADLALGDRFTCARLTDGTVKCWGSDEFGQLGNDAGTTHQNTPQIVKDLKGVTHLHAGWNHVCAVIEGGTVKCWGWNEKGQLGDGSMARRDKPVPVKALSGIADVALGISHSCARSIDGEVQCWGLNLDGQLGDGTTTTRGTPAPVKW